MEFPLYPDDEEDRRDEAVRRTFKNLTDECGRIERERVAEPGLGHEARSHGAFTAEINLEATPASAAVNLAIQGAAEEVLPLIAARMSAG